MGENHNSHHRNVKSGCVYVSNVIVTVEKQTALIGRKQSRDHAY